LSVEVQPFCLNQARARRRERNENNDDKDNEGKLDPLSERERKEISIIGRIKELKMVSVHAKLVFLPINISCGISPETFSNIIYVVSDTFSWIHRGRKD
jgi:hypothetical protein